MDSLSPYDPLSRLNLGISIERALLDRPVGPLPPTTKFLGAGIYAIYYQGDFAPYAPISSATCEAPIYVGKAVPEGARRGKTGLSGEDKPKLYDRLRQHATSINVAENLRLEDFSCRFLVVEDIWIPLGESLAIKRYKPLWNVGPVDGFGNHAVGKGREAQQRSAWDVLHPGRKFAERLTPTRTPDAVTEAVRLYLAGDLPPVYPEDEDEEDEDVAPA